METPVQCKLDGMTCGNCALTVTNYLKSQGARDAVANAGTGDVSFVIDDATRVEALYQGIEQLGYKVVRDAEGSSEGSGLLKKLLLVSILFWVPLMAHMVLPWPLLHHPLFQLLMASPVMGIGIYYFGAGAWRSLQNRMPNMDVLVFIGSTAAFVYSILGWIMHPEHVHQYLFFETSASIITLVLAGNYLEEFTVRSTASAMKDLMRYQKTKARIVFTDSIGKEHVQETDNEFVKVGDVLQVNTGDKIPADGTVLRGRVHVDESMMTGESLPQSKEEGEGVIGGTIVTEGSMRMKTTAVGSGTALAQIIQLVNRAQAAKPPMQKLADRISAVFVPLVIGIAVLTFLINYFALHVGLEASMMRTIAVMVIACPCAMGLATPAAVMVGMGRAARNGILVKGGDTLEKFRHIRTVVFDKTGTLTTGRLEVDRYETTLNEEEFRSAVAALEMHSAHPIAHSLCRVWSNNLGLEMHEVNEQRGIGLQGRDAQGRLWAVGSYRLLQDTPPEQAHDLYVLLNGAAVGWIDLRDELRDGSSEVIRQLQQSGFRTVLLSGDRKEKCAQVATALNIKEVYAEMLPAEKMNRLERLMQEAPAAMVGDGINDAPSLAQASIGISLSDATHIAMQSAGVILLNNQLRRLPDAISLGRLTYRTVQQNLFWAFFYNVLAIPVAAGGWLTPTWGAALMALSDVVLILNSLWLRWRKAS